MSAFTNDSKSNLPDNTPQAAEARSKAIRELLKRVERDPALGSAALSVFQHAIAEESDPWAATTAARGIGLLLGPAAGLQAQRALLRREQPGIVARALLEIESVELVPEILDALAQSADFGVKRAAIYILGRLRDERAFNALVDCLEMPALRAGAIAALGELGDLRAIACLEPFERDETRVAELDDRGAVVTIADIAGVALRRVRYLNSVFATSVTVAKLPAGSLNWPPPLPTKSGNGQEKQWLIFLPLAFACAEVPWAVAITLYLLGHPGPSDRSAAVARTHSFDFLASIPALAGLIIGLWLMIAGRLKTRRSVIWVSAGCLVSVPALCVFGAEFLQNR